MSFINFPFQVRQLRLCSSAVHFKERNNVCSLCTTWHWTLQQLLQWVIMSV